MSNLLNILSIALALILLISTILFMALNMPFIYGNGSFGMMVITVIIFAIIVIIAIGAAIKDDDDGPQIIIAIFCLSLLVIPVRGFIASQEMRDPFENINVELVEYYNGFDSVNNQYGLCLEIKYTNNTRVDLELSGQLGLYDGDRLVAELDIIHERLGGTSEENIARYYIADELLYNVDHSNLTIKYTYESIRVENHNYSYDSKEVTLQ